MAYMIPDTLKEQAPLWERILFNRFRVELSDEIIVLHSLGIARHSNKRWGECDFVLITPEGVLCLEVKGGGVQCLEGKWIYTSPNGKSYMKNESPWEQAKNAMFSIKQDLERLNPDFSNILFGFGVVIPDDEFTETGPELEQEYLLDRRHWHLDLSHYIKKLTKAWLERHGAVTGSRPGQVTRRKREIIRKALRPDTVSAYTLASRLNYAEKQLVDLTSSFIFASVHCIDYFVELCHCQAELLICCIIEKRREVMQGRYVACLLHQNKSFAIKATQLLLIRKLNFTLTLVHPLLYLICFKRCSYFKKFFVYSRTLLALVEYMIYDIQ